MSHVQTAGAIASRSARIRSVVAVIARHVHQEVWGRVGPGPVPTEALARELCADLEELGPTFVKLGQLLAVRPDLLAEPYREALGRLRDDVSPMPFDEVVAVLEAAWDRPWQEVLGELDPEPLGSASLGQVYRARTRLGRPVALKIQRPDVRSLVEEDLELMAAIARGLDDHTPLGERIGVAEVVDAFDQAMRLELDYRVEARNLAVLRRVVEDYDRLAVPRPVRRWTSTRVLMMDLVVGQPIDVACAGGPDPELAEELCRAYLDQILVHGMFHADPHAGNLLVDDGGTLHLLDLGMVVRLSTRTRRLAAQLLVSIAERSGLETAAVLRSLCTASEDADLQAFQREVATAVTRSAALRGVQLSLGDTVFELLRISTRNRFRPPAELAVLGRTLSLLDEVGQVLDPHLDVVAVVEDHAARAMRSQIGDELGVRTNATRLIDAAELLRRGPRRLDEALEQLVEGRLTVDVDAFDQKKTMATLQKIANRISAGVVIAAMLITGGLTADLPMPSLLGVPWVTWLLLVGAALWIAMLFFHALRSDVPDPK